MLSMSEPDSGGSGRSSEPHAGDNNQRMHTTCTRARTQGHAHSRVAALCFRACALADYEPPRPQTVRRRRQIYDIYAPPLPISARFDNASDCDHSLVPTRFPDTALLLYHHARLSASLYINKLLGIQHVAFD